MKCRAFIWTIPAIVLSLVACGGGTPLADEPTSPEPEAVTPAPAPAVEEPAATEPKEEAKPKAEPRDRRPLAIITDPPGPETIGTDGAVIRLSSGAELRIPGGSLRSPRNVVFIVDRRGKGDQGKVGDIYTLQNHVPDTQVQLADVRASRPLDTDGDAFVLKLPIPGNGATANLAVETVELDAKGKGKSTWTVFPVTKVETSDDGNKAVFNLPQLPDSRVHLTTRTP